VWICDLNSRQSDGEIENAGKNFRVVQIFLTTPGTNKGLPRTEELHHYRLVRRQAAGRNYLTRYPNALV
jgi:hypothetical protein